MDPGAHQHSSALHPTLTADSWDSRGHDSRSRGLTLFCDPSIRPSVGSRRLRSGFPASGGARSRSRVLPSPLLLLSHLLSALPESGLPLSVPDPVRLLTGSQPCRGHRWWVLCKTQGGSSPLTDPGPRLRPLPPAAPAGHARAHRQLRMATGIPSGTEHARPCHLGGPGRSPSPGCVGSWMTADRRLLVWSCAPLPWGQPPHPPPPTYGFSAPSEWEPKTSCCPPVKIHLQALDSLTKPGKLSTSLPVFSLAGCNPWASDPSPTGVGGSWPSAFRSQVQATPLAAGPGALFTAQAGRHCFSALRALLCYWKTPRPISESLRCPAGGPGAGVSTDPFLPDWGPGTAHWAPRSCTEANALPQGLCLSCPRARCSRR